MLAACTTCTQPHSPPHRSVDPTAGPCPGQSRKGRRRLHMHHARAPAPGSRVLTGRGRGCPGCGVAALPLGAEALLGRWQGGSPCTCPGHLLCRLAGHHRARGPAGVGSAGPGAALHRAWGLPVQGRHGEHHGGTGWVRVGTHLCALAANATAPPLPCPPRSTCWAASAAW